MTDHSNPITDILERFSKWTITNAEHGIYIPLPSPETEQALYEAVKGCVPEKSESYNIDHQEGVNQCRDEVLTNLSELFEVKT